MAAAMRPPGPLAPAAPTRLHTPSAPQPGLEFALPDGAARHAQVRRVQPGDALHLFDGSGLEWVATVSRVGRSEVVVVAGPPTLATDHELPFAVTLAVGMPANERMDALVEKATELGVATLQPLHCERSVLRLPPERAARRQAHWQAVAVAACEQCGRARVPKVAPVTTLEAILAATAPADAAEPAAVRDGALRWMLSLAAGARPPRPGSALSGMSVTLLSGPEGGLSPVEQTRALAVGYAEVSLGPRVLRADTAPLAVLAWLGLGALGV